MQRATKQKPKYNGIEFDSKEEIEFYQWCEEALRHEFISGFLYHPESLVLSERASVHYRKQLKTKEKIEEYFLLHPHTYMIDFVIRPTRKMNKFQHGLFSITEECWIDIKGAVIAKAMMFNSDAEFSINRKWVWEKFGIYINKIAPATRKNKIGFFEKTWVPAQARYSKVQRKLRACYQFCQTVQQVLNLPEQFPPMDICKPPEEQADLFSNDNPIIDDRGWG